MAGMSSGGKKYITHREVAAILGIHPDYVHDLVRAGKIPATHIPYGIASPPQHRIRFDEAEIRAIRDRVISEHGDMMTKRAHFDTGTAEAKPTGTTSETPEWYQCDTCGEGVHMNDVVTHMNLHRGGVQ